MVQPLSLAQHTLYADLLDQGGDDLFDPDLPENGSLLVRSNRPDGPADHVYYQGYRPAGGDTDRAQRYARYIGRADDPEVAAQTRRFRQVKAVRTERTSTVRALIGAGLPRPDRISGRTIEALARAGLFTDDAVLIGEAAYQTYGGVLGVRLAKPRNTGCRDHPAVELVVRDKHRSASILPALQTVDPSFAADAAISGSYRSATGVQVAVTILDRAAEVIARVIGFLIADPVQAIVLHGPGIPVVVPAPERFAICGLIQHADQDLSQVRQNSNAPVLALMAALSIAGRECRLRQLLKSALSEPRWQVPLGKTLRDLPQTVRASLQAYPDASASIAP